MSATAEAATSPAYAHTVPGKSERHWEPLERHLEQVAALAAEFAAVFGARDWGYILGRCHDLGKYSREFQQYLKASADPDAGATDGVPGRVQHSPYGAQFVGSKIGKHKGQMLAYCIAGHHAGLPNGTADDETTQRSTLYWHLKQPRPSIAQLEPGLRIPVLPPLKGTPDSTPFRLAFFVRMIFSCLVDADRLATEKFCEPQQADHRRAHRAPLGSLRERLMTFMEAKQAGAPSTDVNRWRADVLNQCVVASAQPRGFFSLQVPTGGGKTYSSLAFALHHACRHDLRRIVYAIPYTSIIEQTTDAFRVALGAQAGRALIEHHSDLRPSRDTRANQFGTENWDAPVIVTTNVQLFESLFAYRPGPSRKLHRLANSVIILDEAQMLPVKLLQPTLEALKELVLNYGCSVVLCTATQPALEYSHEFPIGIPNAEQIVPDTGRLFDALKRVEIHKLGKLSNAELAARLAGQRAALCVVNTRRHAAEVFALTTTQAPAEECFHLSRSMCGAHRRSVLRLIRARLRQGKPCRVVSTQLVEAGVDLDFPVVYRASAGFDSIAQAAGRCNREGRLPRLGETYVFEPAQPPPPGLRAGAQVTNELLDQYDDPTSPQAIEAYFRQFYWSQSHNWDKNEVMPELRPDVHSEFLRIQFREAARKYKLIEEDQYPILVAYDRRARAMWSALQRGVEYIPQRKLQPYLVSVHKWELEKLQREHEVLEHDSGVWVLLNDALYSRAKGLVSANLAPGLPYLEG